MISKESVLRKVSEKDIYSHYLKVTNFKNNISSPFTEDKKPSFKVYTKNNTFKCFSSGNQGDVFQFVAYLKHFDVRKEFPKVLSAIVKDLNLVIEDKPENAIINLKTKKFTKNSLEYWEKLGVSAEVLEKYNVQHLDYYEFHKEGQLKKFKLYNGLMGFVYNLKDKRKIYVPEQGDKAKKFFKTEFTESSIFGLEQLPEKVSNLIITAGEKDCITANANGFYSISFNSETVFPSASTIRMLREKCDKLFICYDSDKNGVQYSSKLSIKYNIPRIELPQEFNDIAEYLPANKEGFRQLIEKAVIKQENRKDCSVFIEDNCYYTTAKAKGSDEYYDKQLTNFTIKVIALISSESNPRRIVQVKGEYYETEPFEFAVEAFVSKNAFKKALESKGNFFFYGTDNDLMEIKKLAFLDCEITREVTDLGYDSTTDSYVMSNCVLKNGRKLTPDKFGIVNVNHDSGLYIPSSSILSEDNDRYRDSKKFKLMESSVTFNEFYKMFEKVHGKYAVISLAYLMSAVNFDVVSNEMNCFPLLLAFGPPRSGKSSISRTLMSVFGIPQEAVMLPNATQASISGKMAQFKNALVWLDEFDNRKISPQIIQTLKGLFDLQGRLRKTFSNDNSTYSSAVNSPVTISGQEPPHDEALLSRCVTLQYKTEKYDSEKFFAFRDLDAICKKGLGSVLSVLLSKREIFKKNFKAEFNESIDSINQKLRAKGVEKVNSRLLQSYTMLITSFSIYLESGLQPETSFSNEELFNIFIDQLIFQTELEQDSNEVEVFWQCFDTLVDKGVLKEGYDFKINHSKDVLSFKPSVFDSYRQHMFKTNGDFGLHKATLQNYIKDESYFISNKQTVKFRINDASSMLKASSAWQVMYSALPVRLHKESENPFQDYS